MLELAPRWRKKSVQNIAGEGFAHKILKKWALETPNAVPGGVARSFSEMIWRRSILQPFYGVGARSDVTQDLDGLWKRRWGP